MTEPQTTLEDWRTTNFAAHCRPTLNTVRKWAKLDRFDPPAVKHGRTYYVHPAARYTEKPRPSKPRVIDRIRATETAKT